MGELFAGGASVICLVRESVGVGADVGICEEFTRVLRGKVDKV